METKFDIINNIGMLGVTVDAETAEELLSNVELAATFEILAMTGGRVVSDVWGDAQINLVMLLADGRILYYSLEAIASGFTRMYYNLEAEPTAGYIKAHDYMDIAVDEIGSMMRMDYINVVSCIAAMNSALPEECQVVYCIGIGLEMPETNE